MCARACVCVHRSVRGCIVRWSRGVRERDVCVQRGLDDSAELHHPGPLLWHLMLWARDVCVRAVCMRCRVAGSRLRKRGCARALRRRAVPCLAARARARAPFTFYVGGVRFHFRPVPLGHVRRARHLRPPKRQLLLLLRVVGPELWQPIRVHGQELQRARLLRKWQLHVLRGVHGRELRDAGPVRGRCLQRARVVRRGGLHVHGGVAGP